MSFRTVRSLRHLRLTVIRFLPLPGGGSLSLPMMGKDMLLLWAELVIAFLTTNSSCRVLMSRLPGPLVPNGGLLCLVNTPPISTLCSGLQNVRTPPSSSFMATAFARCWRHRVCSPEQASQFLLSLLLLDFISFISFALLLFAFTCFSLLFFAFLCFLLACLGLYWLFLAFIYFLGFPCMFLALLSFYLLLLAFLCFFLGFYLLCFAFICFSLLVLAFICFYLFLLAFTCFYLLTFAFPCFS